MFKYLLLAALLFITYTVSAQNKSIIKGKVIDSATNTPVEFVTVAVLTLKDTTSLLLSYTITDKTGAFSLHNLPTGTRLKVFISNVAFKPYRKFITFSNVETLDLGNIRLGPNELNELVIKGERPPIVIRKDTIEFNAEAFKTRPNAVVEDLLKKLPGVEVDMNGTIQVNGKDVSKVLVDGHEFFKNDYRIATKNLDVDMIDKVQVYDDREDDPDHLIPDSKVNKIINLKFKKALKKSYFGKLYAGGGTEQRYTAGGLFNMFRDTLQISVLGQGNNLNNTNFSYEDLYQSGGFNRGGSGAFYRGGISFGNSSLVNSINNAGVSGLFGSGIQRTASGGVNINTDYGKKLKINLAYYYTDSHQDYSSIGHSQRFLNDTVFLGNSNLSNISNNIRHNINGSVQWRPNDAMQIMYNPTFSYSDNEYNAISTGDTHTNFTDPLSNSKTTGSSSGNNLQFQQSLSFNYKFKKKGESINISNNVSLSPGNSNGYNINTFTSYEAALPSYLLNRNNLGTNRGFNTNTSVAYRYPFTKKLTGSITLNSEYSHQLNNTLIYNFDPANGQYDSFQFDLSNTLTRNLWTNGLAPGITYDFKKNVRLDVSAVLQNSQVNNQFGRGLSDINQRYFFILPKVNLNIGDYSLSYQSSINMPNIGDMVPYTVSSSPLYSVTGNPYLKPSWSNSYAFNYNKYYMQSRISISGGINAAFSNNSVFRHQTLDTLGATTSRPINMNGSNNWSGHLLFSKNFKKTNNFEFFSITNLTGGENRNYFELNLQHGYQDTYFYTLSEQIRMNWKDLIEIDQSYNFNNSITHYTGVNYNNVSYTTHILNTHFLFTPPIKFNVEGTYTYSYNPMVSPGFQKSSNLLNLSIARELLKKDRGEVKLSCYDILNQSISSYRQVSANAIYDNQDRVLRRYLLLTLQYKFNKSITK
jgi:hypothetical protein